MEKRVLGRTGLAVSALGFGGAEIGFEEAPPDSVRTLLNAALDAGLNVIDTAAGYRDSEEMIGQAVSHRRGDYFLFTKCGNSNPPVNPEDWSAARLTESIDRSLKRLRTDRVDLVQLHSCSEAMLRNGEVIDALKRAKQAGKTRFVGYSGDGAAARYAATCGHFDTLQISVNVADQEAIDSVLPLAVQHNVGVIVKRPIANAAWKYPSKPENWYHQAYWARLRELNYEALKTDMESAVATALRFTLGQAGVHTAIVGTKNPTRWASNAALVQQGPLPDDVVRAIRDRWHAVARPDWVGQT